MLAVSVFDGVAPGYWLCCRCRGLCWAISLAIGFPGLSPHGDVVGFGMGHCLCNDTFFRCTRLPLRPADSKEPRMSSGHCADVRRLSACWLGGAHRLGAGCGLPTALFTVLCSAAALLLKQGQAPLYRRRSSMCTPRRRQQPRGTHVTEPGGAATRAALTTPPHGWIPRRHPSSMASQPAAPLLSPSPIPHPLAASHAAPTATDTSSQHDLRHAIASALGSSARGHESARTTDRDHAKSAKSA